MLLPFFRWIKKTVNLFWSVYETLWFSVSLTTVVTFLYSKYCITIVLPEGIEWNRGLSSSWAKSPTNMIEIPPNCTPSSHVTWTKRMYIQGNMFFPITKNSSIVKHLTPWNMNCKSAKVWPFSWQNFLPLFYLECNVILLIIYVAMQNYEETIQLCRHFLKALIIKFLSEHLCPVFLSIQYSNIYERCGRWRIEILFFAILQPKWHWTDLSK